MKIDNERKELIEETYNVYVDTETNQYNVGGYNAETGWVPIPSEWITGEPCFRCGEIHDDGIDVGDEHYCSWACVEAYNND